MKKGLERKTTLTGIAVIVLSILLLVACPTAPPLTYTVTYDANGADGTVPTDTEAYEVGSEVTVPGNTGNLEKAGYFFAGWNTAADSSGVTYDEGQTFVMGSADVMLYAEWAAVPPTYTMTYDGNNSTGGAVPVDSTNYEPAQTVTVLGNTGNLSRIFHAYTLWNTEADGSGIPYTQGQTFAMGSVDVTLYAQWDLSIGEDTTFRASDLQAGDRFGNSVAISGDYAIVGAMDEDGGAGNPVISAGAAYVFYNNGVSWQEVEILYASDMQALDYFGNSVAISGDYAIVGAYQESGGAGDPVGYAGAAYVFYNNGVSWQEVEILHASDLQALDHFGYSVAISGDYAIVGARNEDGGAGNPAAEAGAAYVFYNNGVSWQEVEILHASDLQADDEFGTSVAISGDYAIVGAYWEDGGAGDPAVKAGAAYLFR